MPSAAPGRVRRALLRFTVAVALVLSALFVASTVVRAGVSSHLDPALSWDSFKEGAGLWQLKIGDGQFRLRLDPGSPATPASGAPAVRGWYAGATFHPGMRFDCSSPWHEDDTSGFSVRSSDAGMIDVCVVGLYAVLGSWAAAALIALMLGRPVRACSGCGTRFVQRAPSCPSCGTAQPVRPSPMWLFLTPTIFAVAAPTACALLAKIGVQDDPAFAVVAFTVFIPAYFVLQVIVGLALVPLVWRRGSRPAVAIHVAATLAVPALFLACLWFTP